MIYQTPCSTAPWSSSYAHMPILYIFNSGLGSARAFWLLCSYAALKTVRCDTLCVLTPVYHSQHFQQFLLQQLRPNKLTFAPHMYDWVHKIISLVHQLSFLGPPLLGTNHCVPETSHKTWCFRSVLTHACLDITF